MWVVAVTARRELRIIYERIMFVGERHEDKSVFERKSVERKSVTNTVFILCFIHYYYRLLHCTFMYAFCLIFVLSVLLLRRINK